MLVSPDKPLRLDSRRRYIHLLLADLVGILLLSAIGLRCPELSGSKTAFLTVFHAEVFLFGLVLPLAPVIQRTHRQQKAFENTCAEVKNKNLVCAKNQEIHADNSKTRIRYV